MHIFLAVTGLFLMVLVGGLLAIKFHLPHMKLKDIKKKKKDEDE